MKIDHVGIAVRSLETALRPYEAIGLRPSHTESVTTEGVRVAFLPVGEAHLELLEPINPEGVIARFLEQRGEGVHHLALAVEDILAAMARARASNLSVIDDAPRPGARGRKVAFIHPKSTHGVLLEFVEYPR